MCMYEFICIYGSETGQDTDEHSPGPETSIRALYSIFSIKTLFSPKYSRELFSRKIYQHPKVQVRERERGEQHPRELESVVRENLTISLVHPRRTV